ncbi:MAG: response regulator, partial [Bdellovibrionota bacterium]
MKENKFVLVVEDDEDLCKAVQSSLNSAGYKAVSAHTLRDAILKIRNQAFFSIVLDIHLGDENGEEVIENARSRSESLNKETPIVVMSGFLDRDLVQNLAGRVQGAIVKPFEAK